MASKWFGARKSAAQRRCLEFNETQLPKHHEAFANRNVKFDSALESYVPTFKSEQRGQNEGDDEQERELDLLPGSSTTSRSSSQRPFWDVMFPEAMGRLIETRDEPALLSGTQRSIRSAQGWPEIVTTLEIARAEYYDYSGFVGFWKKTRHSITNHANEGKTLLSLLPDSDYTSVIHCVFDLIFDVRIPAFHLVNTFLTRYRQPEIQPRFEKKLRTHYETCGKDSQTSSVSLRSVQTMMSTSSLRRWTCLSPSCKRWRTLSHITRQSEVHQPIKGSHGDANTDTSWDRAENGGLGAMETGRVPSKPHGVPFWA
jgi:hypothetical protein